MRKEKLTMSTGYTRKNPFAIAIMHRNISDNNPPKPEILYHYTSMTVMDSLLTKSQFWASSIYYLNDAEEYYNGISYLIDLFSAEKTKSGLALKKILQSIRDDNGYSFEGMFSLSFSTQSDNLHQWITYAKEGGVCIGLDNNHLSNRIIFLDGMEDNYLGKCSDVITKARYLSKNAIKTEKVKNMLKEALTVCFDEDARDKIIAEFENGELSIETESRVKDYFRLFVSYCKNAAFKMENEYRGVFYPLFAKHTVPPTIFYHVTSAGIVRPYIKVGFNEPDVYEGICPLPIKSISIGPAGNQQAVFNSVVHRVKYGTLKTWDYWEHKENGEFKKNFIDYVCGALEEFTVRNTKKVSEEVVKGVFTGLIQDWMLQTDMRYASPEEQKTLMSQKYMPTDDLCCKRCKKKGVFEEGGQTDSKDTNEEEILKYIRKNNYFSKEGIWVKKSQIPYVF